MTVLVDFTVTANTLGNCLAVIPITKDGIGNASYHYKRDGQLPIQLQVYEGNSYILTLGYAGDASDDLRSPESYFNPLDGLKYMQIELLKESNAALLVRIQEFDRCIQSIATELGGVCCGGVDVDQSNPSSTTAVMVDAIRKLRAHDIIRFEICSVIKGGEVRVIISC